MDGVRVNAVRVDLLGPLRVVVDGEPVEVRGPKRRAILALLAFAEGRTVTVDQLVDALWPAEAPESARQALHTHLFRLRSQLGAAAARLQTRQDGYRLDLATEELDLARARALLAAARADPPGVVLLREAHALWRGPVLADLTDVEPIATAVQGCARLHGEVTDALVGAAVAAGDASTVLGLAAESVATDRLREPAVLGLMRALAASGQAPEALRVGREYRRRLADETGLDPSSALGEVERAVAGGAAGPAPPRAEAPAPLLTRLFGREAQVAALLRLLAEQRLLTVVGPGGVGKTRVALELARRTEGATVLLLAPVIDSAAVPFALASAMNLTVTHGDVLTACIAVLGDRQGTIVIDNCEHLLDAVRDLVIALLASCPRLAVLTTSREPLGLAAEHTFRLAPLALPEPHQDPSRSPAVAVFLDRARRVRQADAGPSELGLVADIVRRLDGMPLAIELAAGRLSTFSLADLHARLDRALDLLGGAGPSSDVRHRTLRATVDWSYQLLDDDEQRLFRHLAVFPDGVDLAAAERVAADLGLTGDPGALLARLVDASMVEADLDGPARYRMLETLRAFGVDRLAAAGEEEPALQRLVGWSVDLAAWLGAALLDEREQEADVRLRREIANLRAGWHTARARGLRGDAVAIVIGLFEVVVDRDLVEVRGWAEELAGDPAATAHPQGSVLLATAAWAAYHRGDYDLAARRARSGLERDTSAFCLQVAAMIALSRGAFGEVSDLARCADAESYRLYLLGFEALAKAYAGDPEGGRALITHGLAGPLPPVFRGWYTYFAGEIEHVAGGMEAAEQHYREAAGDGRTCGVTFLVGMASVGLLSVQAMTGREREALAGYPDVLDYFTGNGSWTHLRVALRNLAALLHRLGDAEPAASIRAATAAPDPPLRGSGWVGAATSAVAPTPAEVLDVARAAIARHLSRP